MSLLALTPNVSRTLQEDFRRGVWSPVTQRFFEQLFLRVGGASAPTIKEIHETVITAVVPDFDAKPPPGIVVLVETPSMASLAPLGFVMVETPSTASLAPRQEFVMDNFNVEPTGWQ